MSFRNLFKPRIIIRTQYNVLTQYIILTQLYMIEHRNSKVLTETIDLYRI